MMWEAIRVRLFVYTMTVSNSKGTILHITHISLHFMDLNFMKIIRKTPRN